MMIVVGLGHMSNPLCYNLSLSGLGKSGKGKKQYEKLFVCLIFSSLEKQRAVLLPWGRSVASFYSWANE